MYQEIQVNSFNFNNYIYFTIDKNFSMKHSFINDCSNTAIILNGGFVELVTNNSFQNNKGSRGIVIRYIMKPTPDCN